MISWTYELVKYKLTLLDKRADTDEKTAASDFGG
jgi:hypothetical protein